MRWLAGRRSLVVIVVLALVVVAVEVWAAFETTRRVEGIVAQLRSQPQDLAQEKTRQEVISLRIENELRSFFWHSLLAALAPMVTAFVALVGVLQGLRSYLDARDRERLDRAAVELAAVLQQLVSGEPRERAVGVVGLQHYLQPDQGSYHLRALSALITAARIEDHPEVLRGVRLAVQQAVRNLPAELLRQVSWQGVKLRDADLAGRRLAAIDLRDADLEDADLAGCDLSEAVLINARLNGARLDGSSLRRANLRYADFAGASLVRADLRQADLEHARVWRMKLHGADLRQALFDPAHLPWELVDGWREALYDPGLRERLIERYGPAPRGVRVLMLMWEIPPLVAGGTWTACYHLVRNLRRRGADVAVVVPWDEGSILPSPFGCEVEVVALGIVPPRPAAAPAGWPPGSPYGSVAPPRWGSPYVAYGSPYEGVGGGAAAWGALSPYAVAGFPPGVGSYGARAEPLSPYGRPLGGGSALLRLVDELGRRFARLAAERPFDLIHAHDWVTFDAARLAAAAAAKPWIAHLHSTEGERREADPDAVLERIERRGVGAAARVVVPSAATARRVEERYLVAAERLTVLPNPLSPEAVPAAETGRFETRRVVFLGRLSAQKGPDRFAEIATQMRRRMPEATCVVFGAGEERLRLLRFAERGILELAGPLDWGERAIAFRGASAVVVPSRAEPFGMVVLEAMQHRVPVLYPQQSGAAEVLASGIRIDPADGAGTAAQLERLLADWSVWEETVEAQSAEVAAYADRGYERRLLELWEELAGAPASPARSASSG